MLYVERSNRTEALFAGLAERLTAPGRDPLARSVVVVQGAGMERWIAQRIARLQGVCANVEFPFPRDFLESVFAALPDGSRSDPSLSGAPTAGAVQVWDLERMTWALAREIDDGQALPIYAPLARHLSGGDRDGRLVALARQIANVFDQYITYRPDWIERFDRGASAPAELANEPDLEWQAPLYRALRARLGPGHIADRARAFFAALARSGRPELARALRRRFPDAVEVFAVSTLPPLHLDVVRGLATLLDVRLSVLTPSRVWYSDLRTELRDAEESGASASPNPIASLLAGLGRLGADFQKSLEEGASPEGGDRERFVAPDEAAADVGRGEARGLGERGSVSLLHRLQARLLDLDEETSEGADPVAPGDDSIRVHLCHGPRRELEVVESLLRAAFERDPSLTPEDVIVMAPDIDAIASDVDAVFGPGAEERGGIPYRIADRGTYRRSPVAEGFRALIALLGTRMARSAVFDWLALPDVAANFGLDEAAVESLSDWAERAGHRFGLDEAHRESLGLPPLRGHTLAGSLDRLMLAHALGEGSDVVRGLVAVGLDPFAEPAWIGAMAEVDALLDAARRECHTPRSVADWADWLEKLLARSLVRREANSHEHTAILTLLDRLRRAALEAGFDRPIAFDAMRARVVAALEETPAPQAFLAGGVTFCQLVPLRAIPFRLVVLTGLVDGSFPRYRTAPGFDLLAKHPRAGDRSVRDDDRHLFLEAILSAREKLVVTVPARDLKSGEARATSIVVSELIDALDASFALEPVAAAPGPSDGAGKPPTLRDRLVVTHPLQPTSARYFERGRDPRLESRSERAFRGALARQSASREAMPAMRRFLVPGSSGAASGTPVLTLDELIERVLSSTRHHAREVLGLRLPRPEVATGDLDAAALSPLEQARLGRALFADLADGMPFERAVARLQADPLLPDGFHGELLVREIRSEARAIAAIAAARRSGERLPDLPFEIVLPASGDGPAPRIVGRLDSLWRDARIEAGFGRLGGDRESALWIRHLVLSALVDAGHALPTESLGIGRPPRNEGNERAVHKLGVVAYGRVDAPLPILEMLVGWASSVSQAPLPLFERASRAFAHELIEGGGSEAAAWRKARSEFEGRDDTGHRTAEGEQSLEMQRVWEGRSPIGRAEAVGTPFGFDELASKFFAPMFAARRRLAQ